VIYYPYENRIPGLNILSIDQQNNFDVDSTLKYNDPVWKVAIYPRLVKQTRVSVGANSDMIYNGEWDIDLVILPEYSDVGRIANLIGKLYVSYVQS